MLTTVATGMRRPRWQGTPPVTAGSTVILPSRHATPSRRHGQAGCHATNRSSAQYRMARDESPDHAAGGTPPQSAGTRNHAASGCPRGLRPPRVGRGDARWRVRRVTNSPPSPRPTSYQSAETGQASRRAQRRRRVSRCGFRIRDAVARGPRGIHPREWCTGTRRNRVSGATLGSVIALLENTV
jgi:hypothetical protein